MVYASDGLWLEVVIYHGSITKVSQHIWLLWLVMP